MTLISFMQANQVLVLLSFIYLAASIVMAINKILFWVGKKLFGRKDNHSLEGGISKANNSETKNNTSFLPPLQEVNNKTPKEEDTMETKTMNLNKCTGCGEDVPEGSSACKMCILKTIAKYSTKKRIN